MSPVAREGVARLGQVGYIPKGVALGVVGSLLSYAAPTFDRQKAQGLDGALQTILAQPFGRFLLTAVALGWIRGLRPVHGTPVAIPPDVTSCAASSRQVLSNLGSPVVGAGCIRCRNKSGVTGRPSTPWAAYVEGLPVMGNPLEALQASSGQQGPVRGACG
jgi:hypothetical protein